MLGLALLLVACDRAPYDPDGDGAAGLDDCAPYDPSYSEIATWFRDSDGDGFGDPDNAREGCEPPAGRVADNTDCDDATASVHPDQEESPGNGVDDDCDPSTHDQDHDRDGYPTNIDCDDADPEIYPGAEEVWYDGVDQDCDGERDDDADRDGYSRHTDCDDDDPEIHPHAEDLCGDGIDSNCSGLDGERRYWYADADGDGWGRAEEVVEACAQPSGYVERSGDCDDGDGATHPEAEDACGDGLDSDCDGADGAEQPPWYLDVDGDGYGQDETATAGCDAPGRAYVGDGGDCDDDDPAIHPGAEEVWYDGIDQDCDGDDADRDGDGYASDSVGGEDCDDGAAEIHPFAFEDCDGRDEDCDAIVDEEAPGASRWYADSDGDGYGDPGAARYACGALSGHVADSGDCDDGDAGVNPGAAGDCGDGVDTDCDGALDLAWYPDADGDGYGDAGAPIEACSQPDGYTADDADCEDGEPDVNPSADEICGDDLDNDCDGSWEICGHWGAVEAGDADAVFFGLFAGDRLGEALVAGDVDGDGALELILAAPGYAVGAPRGGGAFVIDPGTPGASSVEGASAEIVAETPYARAGAALGAADLDGDGIDDLLLGGAEAYGDRGAAWLLFGPLEDRSLDDADASWSGATGGDAAGAAVALLSDLDGDRAVAIGAPGEDSADADAGAAYVFYDFAAGDAGDLADADAQIYGEGSGDAAGTTLVEAGDTDGDGHTELLIGAPRADVGGERSGAVYLLAAPEGAVDLADADARLGGSRREDRAGAAVAAAGDVDGDGYADLLIGAPRAGGGTAYLILGPSAGERPLSEADATFTALDGDEVGASLSGGRDVDGDGAPDLLIGGPGGQAVWIVLGPVEGAVSLDGADAIFTGEGDGAFGAGALLVEDLDGDGDDEALISDPEALGGGVLYLFEGSLDR